MRIEKKTVKTEEVTHTETTVVCDLCGVKATGKDWDGGAWYNNVNGTEIKVVVKQKEGFDCSDGGSGTEIIVDLCPKCFKEKLGK